MRTDILVRELARRLVDELLSNSDKEGPYGTANRAYITDLRAALDEESCKYCEYEAVATCNGEALCEVCHEGVVESNIWNADDPHGDRDPSPEEQAGWAMQDKIDMYRNEY